MNNFFILTKIQLYSLFGINKALHSKESSDKKKLIKTALIMVGMSLLFIGMSVFYSIMFAEAIKVGRLSFVLLPGAMFALGCFLTIINTVYKANGTIFGFKDFDILMSLPIKKSHIILSKINFLYLLDFLTVAVLMIPAGIIYGIYSNAALMYYFYLIITMPFIAVIPLIVGLFFGAIITFITSRLKKSNILSLILYMAFFIGIMFLAYGGNSSTDAYLSMLKKMNKIYPLTTFYISATCDGNILYSVLFIVGSLVLGVIFLYLMGINYLKINTAIITKSTGAKYNMQSIKKSSPLRALYSKEIKRFFALPMYVMNSGIGAIMAIIISVIALVSMNGETMESFRVLLSGMPIIAFALPIAIALILTLSVTTNCSVSLEGKNMWILKSSPIRTKDILLAKLMVSYTAILPLGLISSVLLGIAFKIGIIYHIYSLLMIIFLVAFSSALGLIINLLYVKLEWASEIVVIKQSAAVLMFMLFDMLFTVAVGFGAYFLLVYLQDLGAVLLMLVILLMSIGINYILFKWGSKKFESIN